jgi:hypothetical protein
VVSPSSANANRSRSRSFSRSLPGASPWGRENDEEGERDPEDRSSPSVNQVARPLPLNAPEEEWDMGPDGAPNELFDVGVAALENSSGNADRRGAEDEEVEEPEMDLAG